MFLNEKPSVFPLFPYCISSAVKKKHTTSNLSTHGNHFQNMKHLSLLVLVLFFATNSSSQTRVIVDTDIDSDVDDVAALAMLHNLVSNKEIILSGIIVTSDDPFAPVCVNAVNTYFERKNIPIGFNKKQPALKNHSKYTRQISEEFPHQLISYKNAFENVDLYRKLLSSSPDGSVVIVTLGHLTSMQDLLQSKGDRYSPLNGKDLVEKKAVRWICMGGMYPSGKEANFYRPDPLSTVYCVKEWLKPVIFCGWEAGNKIISGGQEIKTVLSVESPVYRAFELYNNFAGRPSWDQLAILLLKSDFEKYFDIISDGFNQVEADGSNKWITGAKGNHSYIRIKPGIDPGIIAQLINNMTKKVK